MDPTSLFSPEEIAFWASKRLSGNLLYFTSLGMKLSIYLVVLLAGIHLVIRRHCSHIADWLYARPALAALGQRAPVLRRTVGVLERLSASSPTERNRWMIDAMFPVAFSLMWFALYLPFEYFCTFVRPHLFGLSNQTLGQWWIDVARSFGLYALLSCMLGIGLFGLARKLPRSWWLWLWVAVVGMIWVWSMLAPYRASMVVDYKPLPQGQLRQSIEDLASEAGFALQQVRVVNTSKRSKVAGAHFMGEGPTRQVVLGDNLVNRFHPREVLFTVGHELGHQIHEHAARDWITTAFAALVFLALLRLMLWKGPAIRRLRLRPEADPSILPLVLLVFHLLAIANGPLSKYLSRQEEFEADTAGLELTRDPVAYISLMVRLARENKGDIDPPGWVRFYFMSHPSIVDRIRFGLAWAARHGMDIGPGAIPLPAPAEPLVPYDTPEGSARGP
ncbi:MAG: M48 family metalloprotease [Deltaproteobacteria bacterium]|nr:M48 family metalloprotease [Deltaproteobacteria bacterium]